MPGVVVNQFLGTRSTSEADRFRKRSHMSICIGEKSVQLLHLTAGITKIMFSKRPVLKRSRLGHLKMSLGTVLLVKPNLLTRS